MQPSGGLRSVLHHERKVKTSRARYSWDYDPRHRAGCKAPRQAPNAILGPMPTWHGACYRRREVMLLKANALSMFFSVDRVRGHVVDGGQANTETDLMILPRFNHPMPSHKPKRIKYVVRVRHLATGCDHIIRGFFRDVGHAEERALYYARFDRRLSAEAMERLRAQGIAVFRIVSCEIDPDQTKPTF